MSDLRGNEATKGKCAKLNLPLHEQGYVTRQIRHRWSVRTAVQRGEGGFADWVIVTIHALREFKSSSYRALLDELSQMGSGVEKMDREPGELPDFNTVCARYQELNMAV